MPLDAIKISHEFIYLFKLLERYLCWLSCFSQPPGPGHHILHPPSLCYIYIYIYIFRYGPGVASGYGYGSDYGSDYGCCDDDCVSAESSPPVIVCRRGAIEVGTRKEGRTIQDSHRLTSFSFLVPRARSSQLVSARTFDLLLIAAPLRSKPNRTEPKLFSWFSDRAKIRTARNGTIPVVFFSRRLRVRLRVRVRFRVRIFREVLQPLSLQKFIYFRIYIFF